MQSFLSLGSVATAIALVLTVWAWKLNPSGANLMLVIAWVLFAISIYAVLPSAGVHAAIPRTLCAMLGISIVGLLLYQLWTPASGTGDSSKATPRLVMEQASAISASLLTNLSQQKNDLAARQIWHASVVLKASSDAKDVTGHVLVYDGDQLLRSVVGFWESTPPLSGSDAGPVYTERASFRIGQRRRLLIAFKWNDDEEAYCHSQQTGEVFQGRIAGLAIPPGRWRVAIELRSKDGVNDDYDLGLTNYGRNGGLDLIERSASSIASAPSPAGKVARHQLRNVIGDLIQKGRIHQTNVLAVAEHRVPNVETFVGPLVDETMKWHMEVISFTEKNIGHADAMRVSVPAPAMNRPTGLMNNITYKEGKSYGGYDLRSTWDFLVGDLASLESFLDRLPEL